MRIVRGTVLAIAVAASGASCASQRDEAQPSAVVTTVSASASASPTTTLSAGDRAVAETICTRMEALSLLNAMYKKAASPKAKCLEEMNEVRTVSVVASDCIASQCGAASITDGRAYMDCFVQCAKDEKLSTHREKQRRARNAELAVTASEWGDRPDETLKLKQLAARSDKPFDISITMKKGFKPTSASDVLNVFELDEGRDRPFIGVMVTLSGAVHSMDDQLALYANDRVVEQRRNKEGYALIVQRAESLLLDSVIGVKGDTLSCQVLFPHPVEATSDLGKKNIAAMERICTSITSP